MAYRKYIETSRIVKLTGRSADELYELFRTGVIPAHKARSGRWKANTDAVEEYFGIVINKPEQSVVKEESENIVDTFSRCIVNDEHYDEVIERIRNARRSIVVMIANFKKFRLKPAKGKNYNDGTPFLKMLIEKAKSGVSVKALCSSTSYGMDQELEMYYDKKAPKTFQYKQCVRSHIKMIIIDDCYAYIGSANVTGAGLGQGNYTPGNFEMGILTTDPGIIDKAKNEFEAIWNGNYCKNCHRRDACVKPMK